jgi:hypothetical protein
MKEKSIRSSRNKEKMTTFAKNTAHNEVTLSYCTNVEGEVGQ